LLPHLHGGPAFPPTWKKETGTPLIILRLTKRTAIRLAFQNRQDTCGGMVSGSVILLGGEPGVGKSTLALQLALALKDTRILYVSGEERAKNK